MNELKINILRTPARSIVKRSLGVLYIITGIFWLISRVLDQDPDSSRFPLPFLDIVFFIVFGINGIVFIIEGYGKSIGKLFWGGVYKDRCNKSRIQFKLLLWRRT